MKLISHRGNLIGRIPQKENTPAYIDAAISSGFDVEVDVWVKSGIIWLGHDSPETQIDLEWLTHRKNFLWLHAKNSEALEFFIGTDLHYFFHDQDLATITSKGYVWVYPGNQPIKGTVAVLPELYDDEVLSCIGVCSDNIIEYKR